MWSVCPKRSLAKITSLLRDVWEQLGQLPRMGFTPCMWRPLTSVSHLSWAWVARASATTLVASSTVAARGVTVASDEPALASSSAFEFPRISTCPGIHKNRIEMPLENVDRSVCWISQASLFDEDLFRIDISDDLESEQTTDETMSSFSIWWTTCWMAKSYAANTEQKNGSLNWAWDGPQNAAPTASADLEPSV